MKPDFLDKFIYKEIPTEVEWFNISSKEDLPDLPWKQVYAICNLDGKVPIVCYNDDNDNLPGGTTEPGENVDETLKREIQEELNCDVISWTPLGIQKNIRGGVLENYSLRVYATLAKIGEFKSDPGGGVIGYRLIDIKDLNKTIQWGKTGNHIQQLAEKLFSK